LRRIAPWLLLVLFTGAALAIAGLDRPDVTGDPGRDDKAQDRPRGHLVIVGGGAMPPEVVRRFVELAGAPDKARVLVLPMAGGGREAAQDDVELFVKAGAAAEPLVLGRDEALDPAVADRFAGATGVWFSGGQQSALMAVLRDTPAAEAILKLYRDGAVIGGTSAGAAVMSRLMIPGGERRPSSRPTDDTGTYETIERDNVLESDGLGLLPGAVVDQHFLKRRRHNRLVSVVLQHPQLLGVGIDESAALIVKPDGRWEVAGEGQVMIVDARGARVTPKEATTLGAADVRLHVLPPGSQFDPEQGRVSLPGEAPAAAQGEAAR
jgi:cyanophycinase